MAAYKDEDKGTFDALLHGLGKGVSFGFSDELQGAMAPLADWWQGEGLTKSRSDNLREQKEKQREALVKRYGEDFVKKLESQEPAKKEEPTLYQKAREEARVEEAKRQQAHPLAYGTGDVVGSLLVPLPGAGTAAGLASKGIAKTGAPVALNLAGHLATESALRGAARGLGESTADLTKGEYGQAAKDAGSSALTAAVLSQLPVAAPAVARKIGDAGKAIAKQMPKASDTLINAQHLAGGALGYGLSHDPGIAALSALAAPVVTATGKAIAKAAAPKLKLIGGKLVPAIENQSLDAVLSGAVPRVAGVVTQEARGSTDQDVLKEHLAKIQDEEGKKYLPPDVAEEKKKEEDHPPEYYLPKD